MAFETWINSRQPFADFDVSVVAPPLVDSGTFIPSIVFKNLGGSATPDLNSGTDAALYTIPSVPPTSGLVLLAITNRRASTPDTPTLSGWGLTWTQIGSTVSPAAGLAGHALSLFGAIVLSSAVTGAVTIDYGANIQLNCTASFVQVLGVDLSGGIAGAVVQIVTDNTGTTAAPTLTLAAAGHANNRPYAAFMHQTNEGTTPRTNWTEADDMGGTGAARGLETQYRSNAFETTASATWATTEGWAGIAIELKAILAPSKAFPMMTHPLRIWDKRRVM